MFFLEQEKQSSGAPPAGARLLRLRTAAGSLTAMVCCARGAVIVDDLVGDYEETDVSMMLSRFVDVGLGTFDMRTQQFLEKRGNS